MNNYFPSIASKFTLKLNLINNSEILNDITVKPLNSGQLQVWSILPAIRRCLLFGGLVKIFSL